MIFSKHFFFSRFCFSFNKINYFLKNSLIHCLIYFYFILFHKHFHSFCFYLYNSFPDFFLFMNKKFWMFSSYILRYKNDRKFFPRPSKYKNDRYIDKYKNDRKNIWYKNDRYIFSQAIKIAQRRHYCYWHI